jgi:hypothetical protein
MWIENMANQFIQQSNQNMLWKIINNTPQMIRFFAGAVPGEKERWFQQVVGHVYEDNLRNSANLSLREMNKVAIDLMVELLKKAQSQAQLHTISVHNPVQIINKPSVSNNSSMENQFELRRKEYENMTKKTIPTPSFTENIKDEAIGDIGSAVNEYMKQRDMDAKLFAPKEPIVPVAIEIQERPLEIEEIDNTFLPKKVKWGENTEHVYKEKSQDDPTSIAKILEMLETLSEQVEMIKSLLQKHIENKQ